ncbi:MAG: hypothetical protein ABUK01_03650 [Leptospirales bacterium]
MAIASLVLGIIGVAWILVPIPGTFWIGVILGVIAIVLGVLGKKEEGGAGKAKAGMILGIVAVIVNIAFYVLCMAAVAGVANEMGELNLEGLEELKDTLEQLEENNQ